MGFLKEINSSLSPFPPYWTLERVLLYPSTDDDDLDEPSPPFTRFFYNSSS